MDVKIFICLYILHRLINFGGSPHSKGMIAEELPEWLQKYVNKTNILNIFDDKLANHVLVNEYHPNEGIMAHLDGPLFYPTISTISVGSHTFLEFFEPTEDEIGNAINKPIGKLMVERRSLLILKDDMYHKFLHSIEERKGDVIDEKVLNLSNCGENYKLGDQLPRDRRISLTIRHVPKTSKMKIKLR